MEGNYSPLVEEEKHDSTKKRLSMTAALFIILIGIVLATLSVRKYVFQRNFLTGTQSTARFIMINDLHIDPFYVDDSDHSVAKMCRKSAGSGAIKRPFGQYKCDTPMRTFHSMCDFLPKAERNPAFILFGGDCLGHKLKPTKDDVAGNMSIVINSIAKNFNNVPVLFTIGNNDLHPDYGTFDNDKKDLKSLAKIFGKYMTEEQLTTFKKGGYYYQDIPSQNLRLLLLNTVIYNEDHGDYDPKNPDPYDQFAWIKTVSQDAVDKKMKVAISMHIPPVAGRDKFTEGFREEYAATFYETIKSFNYEFFINGHVHSDLFLPMADNLFTLSAPSVSPIHENNPGFRVYELQNGGLSNFAQFFADIRSNPQDSLEWKVEYDFNSMYGTDSVSMDNIRKVVEKIQSDNGYLWKYKMNMYTQADELNSFYICKLNAKSKAELKKCTENFNVV